MGSPEALRRNPAWPMIGTRAATGGIALKNAAESGLIGIADGIRIAPVAGVAVTGIAIMKPAVKETASVKWL